MKSIADIRKDYSQQSFSENEADTNPIQQFAQWWNEAVASEIDEVNAMTLATADAGGKPSARIVLLKDFDEKGFVFFTNYESQKGKELLANPHACLVFFWKELERQVRIEGVAEKISAAESDEYFFSRPAGSRIGAWASPQSSVINNRNILDENVKKFENEFGENIPRPPHWGGYRVAPSLIEFWQGRSNWLHDRIRYKKEDRCWKMDRLAP